MSTVRIVGALLVLAAVLAGCSSTDAAASGPDADGLEVVRGTPLGEIQAEPAAGTIKLWVSNQSFGEDPVRLTVRIGDTTVVDDSFEVLGQHNWIAFDMSGLAPGSHTLRVVSDTGADRKWIASRHPRDHKSLTPIETRVVAGDRGRRSESKLAETCHVPPIRFSHEHTTNNFQTPDRVVPNATGAVQRDLRGAPPRT